MCTPHSATTFFHFCPKTQQFQEMSIALGVYDLYNLGETPLLISITCTAVCIEIHTFVMEIALLNIFMKIECIFSSFCM